MVACGACAGRHSLSDPVPGRSIEIPEYVARLEPSACGQKRQSGLQILPLDSEQMISVDRGQEHFQVAISFCPETQRDQEEQLFAIAGGRPQDMLAGTSVGETRCSFTRYFEFLSGAQVAEFLQRALSDVMGVTRFGYRYDTGTLVCDAS